MTKELQFRRGNSAEHAVFKGAPGEITVNTDNFTAVVHDNQNFGGFPLVGTAATQRITNKDIVATQLSVSGVTTSAQSLFANRLSVSGVSTFNTTTLIGAATSTGTASQILQVNGGAYFNGVVGLGVTNPTVTLQLPSTGNISNQGTALGSTVGAAYTVVQFYHSNGNGSYLRIKAARNATGSDWTTASTKIVNVIDVTEQGYIEFNPLGSNYGIALGQGSSEYMRISNGGSVGIGITNPVNRFVIGGETAQFPQSFQVLSTLHATSRRASVSLGGTIGSQSPDWQITLDTNGNGTKDLSFYSTSLNSSPLRFDTTGNSIFANFPVLIGAATSTGTASQTLQVTGGAYFSGSVGIGTTNPTTGLDVVGEITARRINASQEGGQINFTRAVDDVAAYSIDCYNEVGLGLTPRLRFIDNVAGNERMSLDRAGNLLVGAASSTGTLFQLLQVGSGAYFNGSVGIGTTNPTARLQIPAGSSTANTSPLKFTRGTNLSGIETGAIEYDGTILTFTPNTEYGRASIPTTIYTSGAGTNLTATAESTLQVLFPAANDTITLQVGTYYIQLGISVTRGSTSTTSATLNVQLNGGGTAAGTFSGMSAGSVGSNASPSGTVVSGASIATSTAISATNGTAGGVYTVVFSGIMKITTAGTFQPKYALSAIISAGTATAPSAANFLRIQSIASSGSVAATGAWA